MIIKKIKNKIEFIFLKSKIKLFFFNISWRRKNRENFTNSASVFDITKVKVGKMTYGTLNVYMWGNEKEKLEIGGYVSISPGVKFLLGGNHNLDTFSTYPFKNIFLGEKSEACSKGKIVVEDDVWIGMDVMILSGLTIGRGAVIAAGSVVTKDIPPYAVAAGNPAKVVKYRFTNEMQTQMNKIDFSKIDYSFVEKNINNLYSPLNIESLNGLIENLEDKLNYLSLKE